MVFMEGIYKDLISIMSDIVIKREDLALEGESLESRREFEIYLASVNGTATFLTFPSYEFLFCANIFHQAFCRNVLKIIIRFQKNIDRRSLEI